MLELDGSNAGGQFFRSALTLSALTNRPVRIENVRHGRPTSGLGAQHLAVLETMTRLCDATVTGDELGADDVMFDPTGNVTSASTGMMTDSATDDVTPESIGDESRKTNHERPLVDDHIEPNAIDDSARSTSEDTNHHSSTSDIMGGQHRHIPGGTYDVAIETAGSVTLLFDALLALAPALDSRLVVTATGGTDVTWSPPIEYFRRVKLPLLRRFGLSVACEMDRRGFYPAGGGRVRLFLDPSTLDPLHLESRGSLESVRCYSAESASLSDRSVASRQIDGALEGLGVESVGPSDRDELGSTERDENATSESIELAECVETTAASSSPGSSIVLCIEHTTARAGFSVLGERGKPAETVGKEAADAAVSFLDTSAPIDRHLADQLLIFLALAGGRIRIPAITDHVETSRSLLSSFGIDISLEQDPHDGTAIVSVDSPLRL